MADLRSFRSEGYNTGNGIGEVAYQRARDSGLDSLQIKRLAQEQGVFFTEKAQVAMAADGFNTQINDLASRLQTQADSFAAAQADWTKQMAAQQALFTQQQNRLENLQNSNVPTAENTAAQDSAAAATRTAKRKTGDLSSLSIVSGLGTQSNPLAGIQLA